VLRGLVQQGGEEPQPVGPVLQTVQHSRPTRDAK
jgi:hypothetical protein